MTDYPHLKRWTTPTDWFGTPWPDYYRSGCGRSRDSGTLEQSNFECMLAALREVEDTKTERDEATVQVVRESHWLVGWVESILIHESDAAALAVADRIAAKMEDYPVIDEEHWSTLEWEKMAGYWDTLSPRGKVAHAIDQRKRRHWLADVPAWPIGRMDFCTLANSMHPLASGVYESLRED